MDLTDILSLLLGGIAVSYFGIDDLFDILT
jgi:hypothetical protein